MQLIFIGQLAAAALAFTGAPPLHPRATSRSINRLAMPMLSVESPPPTATEKEETQPPPPSDDNAVLDALPIVAGVSLVVAVFLSFVEKCSSRQRVHRHRSVLVEFLHRAQRRARAKTERAH